MKILMTLFKIQDYGGLVNETETYTKGFKELGHDVTNITLVNNSRGYQKGRGRDYTGKPGYEIGIGTGLWIHHKGGWSGMDTFGYNGRINEWIEFAEQFDLIIHQISVPTKTKQTKGCSDWINLYDVMVPQIAVVPDANFQKLYPHLYRVMNQLEGVICVHEAGYNSCEKLPIRRALVPSPHIIPEECDPSPVDMRQDGFISVQNFKPIKRVEDLIKAIPHMDPSTQKIVAGGGIEYHYMTSKTKVKKQYLDEFGVPIWDNALENGMEFIGYIDNNTRNTIMDDQKLLIDSSWSERYYSLGPHFNRTFVEAMIAGCVPVCTDKGLGGSRILKAGEHYIETPWDATPEEYAKLIEDALADEELLEEIQQNNIEFLPNFSHHQCCQWIIDFANGEDNVGLFGEVEIGTLDKDIQAASDKAMLHFEDELLS